MKCDCLKPIQYYGSFVWWHFCDAIRCCDFSRFVLKSKHLVCLLCRLFPYALTRLLPFRTHAFRTLFIRLFSCQHPSSAAFN